MTAATSPDRFQPKARVVPKYMRNSRTIWGLMWMMPSQIRRMTEAFRSGVEAVNRIQEESALSLGLTRRQAFLHVILPQAMAISVPAFMANVIFLMKETSVFSAISLMDLMFTAKDQIGLYYRTTEALVLLVAAYLIILLPLSLLGTWWERRLRHAGFGS